MSPQSQVSRLIHRLVRTPGRRLDWEEASIPILIICGLWFALCLITLVIGVFSEHDPQFLFNSITKLSVDLTALIRGLAPSALTFVVAVLVWLAIPQEAPRVLHWPAAGSPTIAGAEEATDLERTRAVVASACVVVAGLTTAISLTIFLPAVMPTAALIIGIFDPRSAERYWSRDFLEEALSHVDASAAAALLTVPLTLIAAMAVARYTALSPVTRYLLARAERQRLHRELTEVEANLAGRTGSFRNPPLKLLTGISAASFLSASALVLGLTISDPVLRPTGAPMTIGASCILLVVAVAGMRMARARRSWLVQLGILLMVLWCASVGVIAYSIIAAFGGDAGITFDASGILATVLSGMFFSLIFIVPGAVWVMPVWWWKQSIRTLYQADVDRAVREYATACQEEERLEGELRSLVLPNEPSSSKLWPPAAGHLLRLIRGRRQRM